MEVSIEWWLLFHAAIIVMLFIDLFTSKGHKLTLRRDILFSVIWIGIGLAFGGTIWLEFGAEEGIKYLTAYVTEKALSVDNLFIFLVIFTYFSVPFERQHKVLFYGIVGAVVFRAAFIFAGITMIELFHPIIYVFGAILLISGYKLFTQKGEATDPGKSPIIDVCRRVFPICKDYDGDNFLSKLGGSWVFTPLLIVLLVVETTDIMFALDSVPAVLTITGEFFTAYTSNIMAILGLRSLYFVISHAMGELKYLSKGLACVLVYLGGKTIGGAFGLEVPLLWNMVIVLGTIGVFTLWSIVDGKSDRSTERSHSRMIR
ncbi:TPA: TerC/Alx family metal homeostasis membrane protein [Candidatus Bathyarchaeota archaeon]|nr:TerC/Alx family metal homeostasis membrane protein [Candidatus Bathyarchaeota archaeon]